MGRGGHLQDWLSVCHVVRALGLSRRREGGCCRVLAGVWGLTGPSAPGGQCQVSTAPGTLGHKTKTWNAALPRPGAWLPTPRPGVQWLLVARPAPPSVQASAAPVGQDPTGESRALGRLGQLSEHSHAPSRGADPVRTCLPPGSPPPMSPCCLACRGQVSTWPVGRGVGTWFPVLGLSQGW